MKIQLYDSIGELQQTIKVTKNEVEEGYDYHISNPASRTRGVVEVTFKDLNWFGERGEPVFEFLEHIVPEEETIAEIERFYPHGQPLRSRIPRPFLARGIGTSALRTVLHDLKREGIRNFYCFNPEEAFYRILLNEHFRELNVRDRNEHLLRRLKA